MCSWLHDFWAIARPPAVLRWYSLLRASKPTACELQFTTKMLCSMLAQGGGGTTAGRLFHQNLYLWDFCGFVMVCSFLFLYVFMFFWKQREQINPNRATKIVHGYLSNKTGCVGEPHLGKRRWSRWKAFDTMALLWTSSAIQRPWVLVKRVTWWLSVIYVWVLHLVSIIFPPRFAWDHRWSRLRIPLADGPTAAIRDAPAEGGRGLGWCEQTGRDHSQVESDTICYNALISACAASSEWKQALHWLSTMLHCDQISS